MIYRTERKRSGLIELMAAICFFLAIVAILAINVGIVYVAVHFITKYW